MVTTFISVDYLLQLSEIQVIVYSGQYDVICGTKGTVCYLMKCWNRVSVFYRMFRTFEIGYGNIYLLNYSKHIRNKNNSGSFKVCSIHLPALLSRDVAGAMDWVHTLQWEGMAQYYSNQRQILRDPETGQVEMFVKAHRQFKFYWILDAGHVVCYLSTVIFHVNDLKTLFNYLVKKGWHYRWRL